MTSLTRNKLIKHEPVRRTVTWHLLYSLYSGKIVTFVGNDLMWSNCGKMSTLNKS